MLCGVTRARDRLVSMQRTAQQLINLWAVVRTAERTLTLASARAKRHWHSHTKYRFALCSFERSVFLAEWCVVMCGMCVVAHRAHNFPGPTNTNEHGRISAGVQIQLYRIRL